MGRERRLCSCSKCWRAYEGGWLSGSASDVAPSADVGAAGTVSSPGTIAAAVAVAGTDAGAPAAVRGEPAAVVPALIPSAALPDGVVSG